MNAELPNNIHYAPSDGELGLRKLYISNCLNNQAHQGTWSSTKALSRAEYVSITCHNVSVRPVTTRNTIYMQTILLGSLITILVVGLSTLGLFVTRRFAKPAELQKHHDVAGFISAILGVIYGVLLAFVVFVVWTHFDNARTAVEAEADGASDLYRMAYGFPANTQNSIRTDIHFYVESVIADEWPQMRNGKSSPITERSLDRLWSTYSTIDPSTNREIALYQESISRLNDMTNCRRDRLVASRTGVPGVMWFTLIFGGIATIAFTYFFGAENSRAQAGMTIMLSALIALVLFLIAALNYPFRGGDIGITTQAFRATRIRFSAIINHEKEKEKEKVPAPPMS